MAYKLTSPDGIPITIRPIEPGELEWIVLRCWPDRETLDRLFAKQGTIGMAAWEDDKCVAQLHCYRVDTVDGGNEDWPEHNNWLPNIPRLEVVRQSDFDSKGPVWCHACCHVGRTLEIAPEESLPSGWAKGIRKGVDPRYLGRGIGTALCEASVQWAREHDYGAVLAMGAPDSMFEFAVWSGALPWTSYTKLGFEAVAAEREGAGLPEWAQGNSPPEVMSQVKMVLAGGRPAHEFYGRLTVLDLRHK